MPESDARGPVMSQPQVRFSDLVSECQRCEAEGLRGMIGNCQSQRSQLSSCGIRDFQVSAECRDDFRHSRWKIASRRLPHCTRGLANRVARETSIFFALCQVLAQTFQYASWLVQQCAHAVRRRCSSASAAFCCWPLGDAEWRFASIRATSVHRALPSTACRYWPRFCSSHANALR